MSLSGATTGDGADRGPQPDRDEHTPLSTSYYPLMKRLMKRLQPDRAEHTPLSTSYYPLVKRLQPDRAEYTNATDLSRGDCNLALALACAGNFAPVEQAPNEPAKGYYKGEIDRVPSISPIEHKPLDQTKDPIRSRPKHVIVVLREEGVADLASSLQTFAPHGSTITVISKQKPEVTAAPLLLLLLAQVAIAATAATCPSQHGAPFCASQC